MLTRETVGDDNDDGNESNFVTLTTNISFKSLELKQLFNMRITIIFQSPDK